MNLTYLISPIAEQDIDEIITYIAQESPKVAYDFVDALYDSFDKLALNPYLGHTREDLTKRLVRFWTFKWHYAVLYKPESPIEIIRILSGYRDIINIL